MVKLFFLCLLFVCSTVFSAPVTSPFGWRVHPISGQYKFHTGTDIGMEYREPIGSLLDGVVVYAAPRGGYGNCVIVSHGEDHTLYGHMDSIACRVGDEVKKGTLLGYVGSTGYSTGPHLHLEWWHNGQYTDPMPLLNGSYTVPVAIDYGKIGFAFKSPEIKTTTPKPKKKRVVKEQEWTAKDYMELAALHRLRGRKDNPFATKMRRKSALIAAGIGVATKNRAVVRKAVTNTRNGFSF